VKQLIFGGMNPETGTIIINQELYYTID